jgi:hypothetical protein
MAEPKLARDETPSGYQSLNLTDFPADTFLRIYNKSGEEIAEIKFHEYTDRNKVVDVTLVLPGPGARKFRDGKTYKFFGDQLISIG